MITAGLWIPLTIAAAFLQNLRSMLQKRLTGVLSVNGAAYARFCYALPFAWIYLYLLAGWESPPTTNVSFWIFCAVGSLGQIFASACLLSAFTLRSFAVSTALSKTEVVQTALLGLVVLHDQLAPQAVIGIGVSFIGVLLLGSGLTLRDLLRPGYGRTRGLTLGLLAGAGLAVSVVGFRGAALALPEGSALMRAGLVLAVALTLQTLVMGAFLALREPGQLSRVAGAWRGGALVGLCGAAASVGWFTAMTLQTAALVRALGQVELLFALLVSGWVFRERISARELVGVGALVFGIYLLL
ncbi:MAG: hypothetical protein ACNA7W_06910 [Pseudomonadales bacterium]